MLKKLYGRILVPTAVAREVEARSARPGGKAIRHLDWMKQQEANRQGSVASLRSDLDAGEAQAIALAVELRADLLLMDERKGRHAAKRAGLKVTGTVGTLIAAKQQHHIETVRPLLDALRQEAGFWISDALHRHALELAGE